MHRALPVSPAFAARLSGTPLAIFLDIDGTLAPIAPHPGDARVPAETLSIIHDLGRLPDVHVAVVTGRSVADARRLVPLDHVGIIGNHGFEILGEDGAMIITPEAHGFRDAMRAAADRLAELASRNRGLVLENKIWTLSLHYRQASRDVVPEVTATVTAVATDLGLVVTRGKEVLELRPPVRVNKGTAVVDLARRLHALDAGAAAIYIGDDRTDEDAFHALSDASTSAVTLRVGHPEPGEKTNAEFVVDTPAEVADFLIVLADIRRRPVATRQRG